MNLLKVVPNLIGRIFTQIESIHVDDEGFRIALANAGGPQVIRYDQLICLPRMKWSILGCELIILTTKQRYSYKFLKVKNPSSARLWIQERSVDGITILIDRLVKIFKDKAIDEYLRDSSILYLDSSIEPIVREYTQEKKMWRNTFSGVTLENLEYLTKNIPIESKKDTYRKRYEEYRLNLRKDFYDSVESNPLTLQQRLAVIRNNDRNLVLAAAGTGKTSVMVAKSLDMLDSEDCIKSDILVLAFNKSAAKELKARMIERGLSEEEVPEISTFHALGRKILRDSGIPTYLSKFVDNPHKLEMWVTNWLKASLTSGPKAMSDFIAMMYRPINPFEFKTKKEYDNYISDNHFLTLQGERVKGYQELLIANWLYMNNVDYVYEDPYVTKRRVEIGFDYQPDFHIKGTYIYIEHFGIDREGNTRPDIDAEEYNLSMRRKRELHKECETILLETFHYDWLEGNLEKRLEDQIKSEGIPMSRKSDDEVLKTLNEQGYISGAGKRYLKCLKAIRTERLDESGINFRLEEYGIHMPELHTQFLSALHHDYVSELNDQSSIDFDDMIIRAIDSIKNGSFKPKWRNILVDEFQDISNSRIELIQSLVEFGPEPTLTAVGDDWQSIYRFAGGKLEITTRFNELVGGHSLTKLDKTFRYNSSIEKIAGRFIMQNPEQYKKEVETAKKVSDPQVYLLDTCVRGKERLSEKVCEVIETIRKNDGEGSIAILARYNYLLEDAKDSVKSFGLNNNLHFWTFHKSKGSEADYCIIIGLFRGKSGFPNENKDEAVVEALLPTVDSFPHSEERRLLYVALTRARNKSYLIADPRASSNFIDELITRQYDIHIASKTFEETYREMFKCPLCTDGYFRLLSGKFGDFYRCTSGLVCSAKPRVCEKCGAPSIDSRHVSTCNNKACNNEKIICEKCGRPMKVRSGKYGTFLGCSGYGIKDDQCRNTKKYD